MCLFLVSVAVAKFQLFCFLEQAARCRLCLDRPPNRLFCSIGHKKTKTAGSAAEVEQELAVHAAMPVEALLASLATDVASG